MVDKKYCMSSYMAFRYIEDDDRDFYDGMHHENIRPFADSERIPVHSADDIDREIGKQMEQFKDKKKGVLLSGGMDSAIFPVLMPIHSDFSVESSNLRNSHGLSIILRITD